MKNSDIRRFKNQRAQELKALYQLLLNKLKWLPSDLNPILRASQQLEEEASKSSSASVWGYTISGLILPIKNIKHIEPQGLKTPRLRIDCGIQGNIESWGTMKDPFIKYDFAMTLFGEVDGNTYSLSWHIDRDAGSSSSEHHPLYHIHYSNGLNHLNHKNCQYSWGNAIYLDCPRLSHYPIDLILGIGFCLTNFYPKSTFDNLIKDHQFTHLYKVSQEAILKPYYYNLASAWQKNLAGLNWNDYRLLCPQII